MRVDWADHELRNAESVQKVLRTSNAEISERTEKIVAEKLQEFRGKITDDMMDVVNEGIKPHRDIESLVEQLSRDQLIMLLRDMQVLTISQPDVARAFLDTYPQLKFALICAIGRIGVATEPYEGVSVQELAQARQRSRVVPNR